MRLKFLSYSLGLTLCFFGLLMLPSGAIDFFLNRHGSANCFFLLGSFSFLIGYILFRKSKESFQNLPPLTLFLATSVIWLFMALFSALPFYFSPFFPSFMDAFFESMSGLTTTGASVLPSPENLTAGLMLWRMLLQWIGGIGIIVLALFLFPSLKTKGFSLFSTESSDISEKNFPLFSQNIRMIFRTYLFISFLCFLALSFAGLSPFDALLHMMATVSTGGFAIYGDSIAHYNHLPFVPWVFSFFMVLSALPLFSVVFLLTGQTEKIKKDSQIKTFLSYWLGAILLVLIYRLATGAFTDTYSLITNTVFNISSIATTTGLSNENYELWGKAVSAIFFFIMALGGCAGSTSGGIKAFRINILFKSLIRHIKTKLSPHAIFVPKFNQEPVSDETILNISGFLVLWLSCFVVLSFLLSLSGVDFETALSGVLTGITNTGPGIGKTIGPVGNFSSLTGYGKAIMCLSMMLGRLEFLTLIVLFLPSTWKRK